MHIWDSLYVSLWRHRSKIKKGKLIRNDTFLRKEDCHHIQQLRRHISSNKRPIFNDLEKVVIFPLTLPPSQKYSNVYKLTKQCPIFSSGEVVGQIAICIGGRKVPQQCLEDGEMSPQLVQVTAAPETTYQVFVEGLPLVKGADLGDAVLIWVLVHSVCNTVYAKDLKALGACLQKRILKVDDVMKVPARLSACMRACVHSLRHIWADSRCKCAVVV